MPNREGHANLTAQNQARTLLCSVRGTQTDKIRFNSWTVLTSEMKRRVRETMMCISSSVSVMRAEHSLRVRVY